MKKLIRTCIDIIDKPVVRHLLTPFVTGLAVAKNRSPFSLIYFHDGVWIHRQRGGAVVDRKVNFQTLEQFSWGTQETWGQVFSPKEGDTVIDVGAGIGSEIHYYSQMVGKMGKVVAIEAHPQTFACLKKFCELNHLENVVPLHVAVGDHDGSVLINDRSDHIANSIMGVTAGAMVPLKTLDSIVDSLQLEKINFLKMNIEGAERLAIVGMQTCISKIETLCISCHDFIADSGGSDDLRTKSIVRAFLQENRFVIHERASDSRRWIRDQLSGMALERLTPC